MNIYFRVIWREGTADREALEGTKKVWALRPFSEERHDARSEGKRYERECETLPRARMVRPVPHE